MDSDRREGVEETGGRGGTERGWVSKRRHISPSWPNPSAGAAHPSPYPSALAGRFVSPTRLCAL